MNEAEFNEASRLDAAERWVNVEESGRMPEPSRNGHAFIRSRIRTGEDLKQMTENAWRAIGRFNNPPRLFRRGGPCRIERDDEGLLIAKLLSKERTQHELARAAEWFSVRVKGDNLIEYPAIPPRAVVEDVLATPEPALPVLSRIVSSPVFGADGTLHDKPGYCAATQTFYEPLDGLEVPSVPDNPTKEQIGEAAWFIYHEPINDFPFVGVPEKATAIAAMLLPFVRDAIAGPTPLHLFEKPVQGTGATLLVHVITHPALGGQLAAMTEAKDDEEWRKKVFAKLRGAPAAVLIDNLKRRLDSPALSSVLTAYPQWEDRLLGVSEIHRVGVNCLWLATGNNPALSGEMTRRTIRCRLDPKIDRPWLRTGFRHEDILSWARENRAQLVWSCLLLIRAWFAAGRPEGKRARHVREVGQDYRRNLGRGGHRRLLGQPGRVLRSGGLRRRVMADVHRRMVDKIRRGRQGRCRLADNRHRRRGLRPWQQQGRPRPQNRSGQEAGERQGPDLLGSHRRNQPANTARAWPYRQPGRPVETPEKLRLAR